jgi:hypothetical protein
MTRDLTLRYPPRAVALDYFYTALGLAFTLTPLALVTPLAAVTGVLAFLALLFFLFGLRTLARHKIIVAVSDDGVTLRGLWGAEIAWSELRELKLSYFSTRRDRQGGWMQLRLKGEGRTIRVDSTLAGFEKLAARGFHEARRHGLALAPDTLQNLSALGLATGEDVGGTA